MKFVFQSVSVEQVKKPGQKAPFSKATVFYTYNGEPRKQAIVSIYNPGIFKQVNELEQGTEIEVEVIKNEAGFNEWKSLTVMSTAPAGSTPTASAGTPAGSTTRVVGSNYESKEERAGRQVLIVKQSSLSAATASLTPGAKAPIPLEDILDRAQKMVDWVFNSQETNEVNE